MKKILLTALILLSFAASAQTRRGRYNHIGVTTIINGGQVAKTFKQTGTITIDTSLITIGLPGTSKRLLYVILSRSKASKAISGYNTSFLKLITPERGGKGVLIYDALLSINSKGLITDLTIQVAAGKQVTYTFE